MFLQFFSLEEICCAGWFQILQIPMIDVLNCWMELIRHMYIQKKRSLFFLSVSLSHTHIPCPYLWILTCNFLQAEKLSEYKPEISSTSLITDLKNAELTVAKALEYFNSTRHIVLYYEDIFKDQTVRIKIKGFSWNSVLMSYLWSYTNSNHHLVSD